MVHSCMTPPWEDGSRLTSGHQSVRPTTLQPGCARYTFRVFSLSLQWLYGCHFWCYSQATCDRNSCIFTCLHNIVSNEIPNTSPFSKSWKMTTGDSPVSCFHKVMVFFIDFGLTKSCLSSFQDNSHVWFIVPGFTSVKLRHIMHDSHILFFIPAPDAS